MRLLRSVLSAHHLDSRGPKLALMIAIAAILEVAAGVGLAYVVGFSAVRHILSHYQWPWLPAIPAGLLVSFIGYYYAYRGIYEVEGGPRLSPRKMRAVVIAGFGGFLAHGGASLDNYVLHAAGADDDEASVRVASLGGLEHGILSLGGCAAAITVLVAGYKAPPMDFTLPWAVLPVPGFLIAFYLAERYREQLQDKDGWRGKLGVFLNSIHLVRALFVEPRPYARALAGMALFWAGDMFAAWAGLAAFGFRMNGAQFIVGLATGMLFTRRTGPFAGAGVLTLVLPLTVWQSGAPLAVAVVGLFVYRALGLWLPMPWALSRLPLLREMGQRREAHAGEPAPTSSEPALHAS